MEEVLEVYQRPYDPDNPTVCLDEARKQLVSETRKPYQDEKGIEYVDYEYKREGVANMYMIVEPLGGRREVVVTDTHDRLQWAKIVAHIVEEMYPDASKITLVEDNLSAHKKAALYEVFEPQRARNILNRLEFIRTPKHGSWLNIAECELSVLTRQGIKDRVSSKEELIRQVEAWYSNRNEKVKKVDWQFTTKDARVKLKRLYPTIIT
jgi:hypothetical protein